MCLAHLRQGCWVAAARMLQPVPLWSSASLRWVALHPLVGCGVPLELLRRVGWGVQPDWKVVHQRWQGWQHAVPARHAALAPAAQPLRLCPSSPASMCASRSTAPAHACHDMSASVAKQISLAIQPGSAGLCLQLGEGTR